MKKILKNIAYIYSYVFMSLNIVLTILISMYYKYLIVQMGNTPSKVRNYKNFSP